ncbi:hypothetical protein PFISCL1PPCAC_17861, partial [Pristionchus fissidentatus]
TAHDTPGLVCTFMITNLPNITDNMKDLFGDLVMLTKDKMMCLEINYRTSNATVGEFRSYCNYIRVLHPDMRLSHRSVNCNNCNYSATICRDNCSSSNVHLVSEPRRGCLSIWSEKSLLVNGDMYTTRPAKIVCEEGEWKVQYRYDLGSEWGPPYSGPEDTVAELYTIEEVSDFYQCRTVSPLRSKCYA